MKTRKSRMHARGSGGSARIPYDHDKERTAILLGLLDLERYTGKAGSSSAAHENQDGSWTVYGFCISCGDESGPFVQPIPMDVHGLRLSVWFCEDCYDATRRTNAAAVKL